MVWESGSARDGAVWGNIQRVIFVRRHFIFSLCWKYLAGFESVFKVFWSILMVLVIWAMAFKLDWGKKTC